MYDAENVLNDPRLFFFLLFDTKFKFQIFTNVGEHSVSCEVKMGGTLVDIEVTLKLLDLMPCNVGVVTGPFFVIRISSVF